MSEIKSEINTQPITLTEGTNTLAGCDPARIEAAADAALNGQVDTGHIPELWDGRTAPRIVGVFEAWWESKNA